MPVPENAIKYIVETKTLSTTNSAAKEKNYEQKEMKLKQRKRNETKQIKWDGMEQLIRFSFEFWAFNNGELHIFFFFFVLLFAFFRKYDVQSTTEFFIRITVCKRKLLRRQPRDRQTPLEPLCKQFTFALGFNNKLAFISRRYRASERARCHGTHAATLSLWDNEKRWIHEKRKTRKKHQSTGNVAEIKRKFLLTPTTRQQAVLLWLRSKFVGTDGWRPKQTRA